MIIRAETPGDYPGVAAVNVSAFNEENEAQLIELIRQTDLYVPDLSLVAIVEERVAQEVEKMTVDFAAELPVYCNRGYLPKRTDMQMRHCAALEINRVIDNIKRLEASNNE